MTFVLISQNWFGKGDTYSFVFWTIPLAIGLAVSGHTILNLYRTKIILLRLLLILVTAGLISFGWVYFVYLILGPWINTFSFPIFYLWIIGNAIQLLFLEWRLPKITEQQKTSKLLVRILLFPLTLVAVVVLIFSFSFLTSYITRPDKEAFLIPKAFRGKVHVHFNEPFGMITEKENGRRLYKIPNSGILLSQFKDEQGLIDQQYYLVDEEGNRTLLPQLDVRDYNEEWTTVKNPHEPSRDSLGVFHAGRVSSDGTYEFYVSTYRQLSDTFGFQYDKMFDLMEQNIIDSCRRAMK